MDAAVFLHEAVLGTAVNEAATAAPTIDENMFDRELLFRRRLCERSDVPVSFTDPCRN
jgi:hypothetical protein